MHIDGHVSVRRLVEHRNLFATQSAAICIRIEINVNMYVCIYQCQHVCVDKCQHVCVYKCQHVCVDECQHVYTCMCV